MSQDLKNEKEPAMGRTFQQSQELVQRPKMGMSLTHVRNKGRHGSNGKKGEGGQGPKYSRPLGDGMFYAPEMGSCWRIINRQMIKSVRCRICLDS